MIHGIINRFQPTIPEGEAKVLQDKIKDGKIKDQVASVQDKAFTGFKGKLKFIGRNIGQNFHKLARTVRAYQKKDIEKIGDGFNITTKKGFKRAYAQLFRKDIDIKDAQKLVKDLIDSAVTHKDLLQDNTPGLRKHLAKLIEDLKPTNLQTDDMGTPEDKQKLLNFQAFKASALNLINKKNEAQGLKVKIGKDSSIEKPTANMNTSERIEFLRNGYLRSTVNTQATTKPSNPHR